MDKTFLSRRQLLSTVAPVALALGLAACQLPGGVPVTPAAIVGQIATATAGLGGMLKQLEAAYPTLVPAPIAAQIATDIADAEAAAKTLGAGMPAASGASVVQQIDGYLNAVFGTLAAPPVNGLIPAPFNEAVAAVSILLPGFEAFVNQYLPASATKAPFSPRAAVVLARARAGAPKVQTTAQAMAVLQRYAQAR